MAHSSSDTAALTLEKSFTYRGVREHFVNTYHLDQVPADANVWKLLADSAWGLEAAVYPLDVQIEKYYGHNPGTPPVLVYESDIPPTGEGGIGGSFTPISTDHQAPGDAAAWVRWGTTQRNSLGKPIYLRNYYHAVFYDTSPDHLSARQVTPLQSLGTAWQNGISISGTTFRRAGPRGAVAQNHAVSTYITTRTLKHRGRRHRITKAELEAAVKAQRASDVPFVLGPAIG